MMLNLHAAWAGMLLGCVAGAIPGLFFHAEAWQGGYPSWRRRMLRLAHISFFGIAFINVAFVFTIDFLQLAGRALAPSCLLVVGAVCMPLVCYLSAYRKTFRHLFAIPAVSISGGVALTLWLTLT